MNILQGLNKLSDIIDKACLVVVVIMLGAMVLLTTAQIICRTFFESLLWSEELVRYLLVWSTFLGASCVYKAGSHISITFLQNLFPPKVQRAIRIFVHVLCIIAFCAVVYYGFLYAGRQLQLAPTLRIPMKYVYYVIPFGFCLMIVHALNAIAEILQEKGGRRV